MLCYFVACLGQEGLSHSSIKTYLSGVRQLHISMGFPEPAVRAMPRLCQVIKGVQVSQGKQGRTPKARLPITPNILWKMKTVWVGQGQSTDPDKWMLWAAATTTFFTFCRSGETTVGDGGSYDPKVHLSLEDVAADSAQEPHNDLPTTETDQD